MADLSYDNFLKSNPKTTKKSSTNLSFESFQIAKKEKEDTLLRREQLIKEGKPVSLNKEKAEPSILGSIVRAPLKLGADVLTNLVNAGQVAVGAKETKPFSGEYLGEVKGLGKVDTSKSPFDPENIKTIIKSASTGAEIASYLNMVGVSKNVITNLTKQGVLASKPLFIEWAKKNIPKLAQEGLAQGIAYTTGSQGREYADTGKPFSAKQAATDIALNVTGNVVIPSALQKVFGTSGKKILNARAAEQAIKDAEIVAKEAEKARINRVLLPEKATPQVINLPEKGILEGQANIKQPVKEVTLPIIDKKTGLPKQSKIIKETPSKQVIKETTLEQPKQKIKVTPETILKDTETISQSFKEPTKYKPGTFESWSQGLRSLDRTELENVAMGGQKTIPTDIPENAYLSVMKNIADETGDIELAQKLARSDVASLEGQGLTASKITTADNIVDAMREVRVERIRKANITEAKFKQETSSLIEKLKTRINDDIINQLICP